MTEKIVTYLTLFMSFIILIYNISSSYAIRGNELKHLNEKLDDVIHRIERLENRIFEDKE